MAPEKTRVKRESPWPQQGGRCGHDDQFDEGQPAARRVPGNDWDVGKRHCQTENCNCDAYNRREKSDQETGAAASQHKARRKYGKRPIAIMDYVQYTLREGRDADHGSH